VAPYDPEQVEPTRILATIKETSYTAQVVSGKGKAATGTAPLSLQRGVALLDEALAQAQKERKPVVLDFFAQRRAPCQRMEKTTLDFSLLLSLSDIAMIRSLPLRITLIKPPPGVPFCLQQGKADLVPPSSDSGENVSFDFTVNIANDQTDGPPKFRGPFVQGPPAGRFIYINSGTYAGQSDSCWSRRAKVPLSGITWELIEEALSKSSAILEALGATTTIGNRLALGGTRT